MPVVYNLGQHGAPSSAIPPSALSSPRSPSSSSLSWLGLCSPWLCGAVLVVAALLFRHRRGSRSRGVSMSPAETCKSTKSPTRSAHDRLRPDKDAFSTSASSWAPTVATVITHGPHASGTSAAANTTSATPTRSLFPYPNLPSPTLSPMPMPMPDETAIRDREIPALDADGPQFRPGSPTSPSAASQAKNTIEV